MRLYAVEYKLACRECGHKFIHKFDEQDLFAIANKITTGDKEVLIMVCPNCCKVSKMDMIPDNVPDSKEFGNMPAGD